MKIKIEIEVTVPDDATHYDGDLRDGLIINNHGEQTYEVGSCPTWYKRKDVADGETWWQWCSKRKGWVLSGHRKPAWAKDLPI